MHVENKGKMGGHRKVGYTGERCSEKGQGKGKLGTGLQATLFCTWKIFLHWLTFVSFNAGTCSDEVTWILKGLCIWGWSPGESVLQCLLCLVWCWRSTLCEEVQNVRSLLEWIALEMEESGQLFSSALSIPQISNLFSWYCMDKIKICSFRLPSFRHFAHCKLFPH